MSIPRADTQCKESLKADRPSSDPDVVHLIGIGGAGMSALARLYLQMGCTVSGSDASDSPTIASLRHLGATIQIGHDPHLVTALAQAGNPLVVMSSVVPTTNPEVRASHELGLPVKKHAEALAWFANTKRTIAVAGTHGKTTTTAMIATAMRRAGIDASFQVGGELVDLDTSASWGNSEWMAIEADEYDRRFLAYTPEVAILTNVEPDHFEYYDSVPEMEQAFIDFLGRVRPNGIVVASRSPIRDADAGIERVLNGALAITHGLRITRYGQIDAGLDAPNDRSQWWIGNIREHAGGSTFSVWPGNDMIKGDGPGGALEGRLSVPGQHNILNAVASTIALAHSGVEPRVALDALAHFHGVRRRFQLAGNHGGVRVFEDYAHHPTEVRVTLAAAGHIAQPEDADAPRGRLWAVFQPHLKVRTERLFDEFAQAFDGADLVVVTDVYSPPGREPDGSYRGSVDLVNALNHRWNQQTESRARHISEPRDAISTLMEELQQGDVVLVMGAGPIDRLAHELSAQLRDR
ncbi:MAG: UDP-N-acetylmuramate--L-alanine ligase [Chloroflexi bacterium]|nr:UDP-N-acetylmuramate--L-alanine ligase [Chloroflexota bacterium]